MIQDLRSIKELEQIIKNPSSPDRELGALVFCNFKNRLTRTLDHFFITSKPSSSETDFSLYKNLHCPEKGPRQAAVFGKRFQFRQRQNRHKIMEFRHLGALSTP